LSVEPHDRRDAECDESDAAEDRELFDEILEKCEIPRPKGQTVFTAEEAKKAANELGYPVLVRPSYVLGGQGMRIAVSDEDVEEDEPRGYTVQKTVNAVLAVLSVVLFFLTQPLVWCFRFVDWWTVLFVLLCGTALAMLIWRRRSESATEEDTDEE